MRQTWRLYQGWFFRPEDLSDQIEKMGPKKNSELWEAVTLPHTFRLEPCHKRGIETAQGIGTYVKYFTLSPEQSKKHFYVTFDAVMGATDVWLNGEHLHTNYGGYLPFVVCLDHAAYFDGRENVLVLRANNMDNGQIPPGKPQKLLDFTYFGGIYRDVWLTAVESVFITDPVYENVENGGGIILEYPVVSPKRAVVSVRTQIRSTEQEVQSISLVYEMKESGGTHRAHQMDNITVFPKETIESTVEIEVENPSLWSLENPFLYDMIVSVQKNGILIDQKTVRFGIRKVEVDRKRGLLINGEVQPFLSGVNRHQDYPIIGNAAPASMQKRDAILYKEAGFRVIRAAHYPMSEEFLNACDELGLLIFEATPGWQWYPTDEPEPFSFRVRENIHRMVKRDRNHPCILAYETVLNETYHVPFGFSRGSAKAALAEQPSAKIASESYGYDASPEANGIDREADFVYGFQQPLEKTEKAVMFLREYTDCYIEFFEQFESRRVTRGTTDEFYPCGEARNLVKANQMLWRSLEGEYSLADCYQLRQSNPAFVGAAIWTGIDSRGAGSLMSPCGIWDGYRLPKTSYWAYASQQEGKAVLHIASDWSEKAPVLDKAESEVTIGSDTQREIYVYANAAKVVLTVERGSKVLYQMEAEPYTEEQAGFLPHPPFYFSKVPYEKGTTLRARGYDAAGSLIAEEEKRSAGVPHHLNLYADSLGIPTQADGNDLVLMRAAVLDEQGILCTDAEHKIFFEAKGDAAVVGSGDLLADTNPARAEAGIASVYLRAGITPGKVEISVSAKGLLGAQIPFVFVPVGYEDINSSQSDGSPEVVPPANLSGHEMMGDAVNLPFAEWNQEVFPQSVQLEGTACWKLHGETYLQSGCKRIQGDPQAELLLYLDDVLRWRGKADQAEQILLHVEGAKELRAELRTCTQAVVLLLSPYLWKEAGEKEDQELFENIAFGKQTSATVHEEAAKMVWQGGTWLGGCPEDSPQEWQVDLRGLFSVRNAMVHVGGQMGSDCTSYQYEIHTSKDALSWEKQTSNCRTSWSNGVLDYFTAQCVRYVKVVFTDVGGRLSAGIQKFEIYQDYGVDSVSEYALAGLVVESNDLVFSPNCLEYTLPVQDHLIIRSLTVDPAAQISISGKTMERPENGGILSVNPVTVNRASCGGDAVIEVRASSGKGIRRYHIHF